VGTLATVERALWTAFTGSSHDHYRQALWRPTRQSVESVALSEKYAGVRGASSWNRRSWDLLGILRVKNGGLEQLLAQPDVDPAVAFTMGRTLVVGKLSSPEDFGHMVEPGDKRGDLAHGLRLGPDEIRFGIGVVAANGRFITPPAECLQSMGPITINLLSLEPEPGFAAINFS
jgi:hypothetical protein